jgi:hypothetical protein
MTRANFAGAEDLVGDIELAAPGVTGLDVIRVQHRHLMITPCFARAPMEPGGKTGHAD